MSPSAAPAPAVSVVVATYRGAGTIGTALRSLAGQTLPPDRFEVVVVQNGELDDTASVLAEVAREHPTLRLRSLVHGAPGLGRARNSGMAMARGRYVTFVDDDDTVSARYLEAMLDCAAPDTVAVAYLAELAEPGAAPDFGASRFVPQLLRSGQTISPEDCLVPLTYSVGKLLPTALARALRFDPDLRGGEDIDFYARFFVRFPLKLRLCPIDAHATYYRVLVPNSMARQQPSYDFSVTKRFDVVERLEAVRPTKQWHRRLLGQRTHAEFRVTNRFLRERPERHAEVLAEIRRRELTSVPYGTLNALLARRLEVVYAGPPLVHPAARAAAERIRAAAVPVDVVAAQLPGVGRHDPATGLVWRPYVDAVVRVPGLTTLEPGWAGVAEFCRQGMEFVRAREALKEPYEAVRSHTFPAAHLLAAQYKARNPGVQWTAAKSGAAAAASWGDEAAARPLLEELRRALGNSAPPSGASVDTWAEAAVRVLADRVLG